MARSISAPLGRKFGVEFGESHLGLCGPNHHYSLSGCGKKCASIATPSDDIVRQCFHLLLTAQYRMFLACRFWVVRPPCLSVWMPHPLLISLSFRNDEISKRNQYTDSHFTGRSRFRVGHSGSTHLLHPRAVGCADLEHSSEDERYTFTTISAIS